MDLSGKWALVTGASRGIGRELANALADKKCNLVIHARKAESCETTRKEVEAKGVSVVVVAAELNNQSEVEKLIEEVTDKIGTPDVIYNNAGIQNEWCDTYESGMDVWLEQFQVNLFSVVQICNAFLPKMKERGSGWVVNVTSDIEGVPQMASYGAAKWAIRKMTSEFAFDLEDSGVHISAMDPGWLRTDLGGPDAPNDVTSVIPGALAPLLTSEVEKGAVFSAQEFSARLK